MTHLAAGLAGALGILLVAVAATVLGWAEILGVSGALLGLVALAFVVRGPHVATWHDLEHPTRVVRGEAACVMIDLELGWGSRTWLSATGHGTRQWIPKSPSGARAGTTRVTLEWPVDTSKRGSFLVGPERLQVQGPWGLHTRVLARREPSQVLVVPRVQPLAKFDLRGADSSVSEGSRAGNEHVETIREYAVGDPMKSVHWRASAHHGSLMVRRMVGSTLPKLLVILDVNARAYDQQGSVFSSFDTESFEQAVDSAASWAWHGCGPHQAVVLTTTEASAHTVIVDPRDRASAVDRLALVTAQPVSACDPARITSLLRAGPISGVVFITGSRTEHSRSWVAAWSRLSPVTVRSGSS
ncbi:MAG: DUF58 domain-containing protein [Candidatus Nanopelagicales bacterium]|nr:DUF58 domain-containing protein [Candidatus Nanopelagicales bacterium]